MGSVNFPGIDGAGARKVAQTNRTIILYDIERW
jgi:hypothetical protein